MPTRKKPEERPGTPIQNRNFLSPTGFKFALKRSPAAAFFCNQANIPSLDLGIAQQTSYLKDVVHEMKKNNYTHVPVYDKHEKLI